MRHHSYHVYILTNFKRTVLYIGMTNDLEARILQHYANRGQSKAFTAKYRCYYLLHFEEYGNVNNAIEREKELKTWRRAKKNALIERANPKWSFLNKELFGEWPVKEV